MSFVNIAENSRLMPEKLGRKEMPIDSKKETLNNFQVMTERCMTRVEDLYEILLSLGDVIGPILKCPHPTCKEEENKLEAESSMEQFIDRQCIKIDSCISLVNSYIDRCCLK
jgi:hypothetical protein